MAQKVWVIDEKYWNKPPVVGLMDEPIPVTETKPDRPAIRPLEKHPGLAFSLSMLVWGGGQLYLGQRRRGLLFLAVMAVWSAVVVSLGVFRHPAARFLAEIPPQRVAILVFAGALFVLFSLIFWLINALDAYQRALDTGDEDYQGTDSALWPLACSLLFPGWGQLLNGQPRKGLFFLFCGLAAHYAGFLLILGWLAWPLLAPGDVRLVFEALLVGALAALPLALVLWMAAADDAFRTGKKLIRKKIGRRNAAYRPGGHGVVRSLVPRGSMVLGLLLALSLGMQFIPKDYYAAFLQRARLMMEARGMEIVPVLGQKILDLCGG